MIIDYSNPKELDFTSSYTPEYNCYLKVAAYGAGVSCIISISSKQYEQFIDGLQDPKTILIVDTASDFNNTVYMPLLKGQTYYFFSHNTNGTVKLTVFPIKSNSKSSRLPDYTRPTVFPNKKNITFIPEEDGFIRQGVVYTDTSLITIEKDYDSLTAEYDGDRAWVTDYRTVSLLDFQKGMYCTNLVPIKKNTTYYLWQRIQNTSTFPNTYIPNIYFPSIDILN